MAENADETRWVSYAELAEARGIDKLSAMRMARRRGWPKQTGNDGTVRVSVPQSVLDGKRSDLRDIPSDIVRKISELEAREKLLTELLERERADNAAVREQVAELREERSAALARVELHAAEAERQRVLIDRLTAWPGAGVWDRLRSRFGRRS
jgi:hypothetical protein